MNHSTQNLSAKVNATFLLLLGILFIFPQQAAWAEAGVPFSTGEALQIVLGLFFSVLALYILKNLATQTKLLEKIMGTLSLVSIACIFTLSYFYLLAMNDSNNNIVAKLLLSSPIICIILFIWLVISTRNKA